jgi:hypothetical protein
MKRDNKRKINYYIIILNRLFKKHLEELQMCRYWMCGLEEVYFEVFKDMCKLLNADIILNEYYILLQNRSKPERFRQFHYYINSMWKIIKSTKDNDELFNLTLTLSELLIEELLFVNSGYIEI